MSSSWIKNKTIVDSRKPINKTTIQTFNDEGMNFDCGMKLSVLTYDPNDDIWETIEILSDQSNIIEVIDAAVSEAFTHIRYVNKNFI